MQLLKEPGFYVNVN